MFAASYFAPRYFAPRYFPPGAEVVVLEKRKTAGVKRPKYWKFEEDLPYPILVQEMEREEDRLILQAYLDNLRRKYKESKEEKEIRTSTIKLVTNDVRTSGVLESNNLVLILMAATGLL